MKIDLRYAGLNERSERRLRIASKLLETQGIRISVEAWDGTRCDILAANAEDAYGVHALDIASRRSIKTVALTSGGKLISNYTNTLDSTEPVLSWVQMLQVVANLPNVSSSGIRNRPSFDEVGICRLGMDPKLRGLDLQARIGTRAIFISASTGRIVARDAGELLCMRDELANAGWEFESVASSSSAALGFSASLDSFYIEGALAAQERLPTFPSGALALSDWPDLGAAAAYVNVLKVVKALMQGGTNIHDVVSTTRIEIQEVSACLWAFAASGLLRLHAEEPHGEQALEKSSVPTEGESNTSLFSKLARRFGLSQQKI